MRAMNLARLLLPLLLGTACGDTGEDEAREDGSDVGSMRFATLEISVRGNLDANAFPPPPFDRLAPEASSNLSDVDVVVFDAYGGPIELGLWFRKDAAGSWEWHVLAEPNGVDVVNSGTLTFDTAGLLVDATETFDDFAPLGERQPLLFDFGRTLAEGGEGLVFTQFATASTAHCDQDGVAR